MSNRVKSNIETALKLHQAGELAEAEKAYMEVLNESKNDLNALNLLGFLKIQIGQFDDAVCLLKKAVEIDSNFFDAWFNLGLAYKNNNKIEDSIYAYNKAIALEANNPNAYFNLAGIFDNLNDTETAVEYYKKAYAYNTNTNDNEIQYLLGISYLKIKEFELGLKHYEHRLSRDFAILTQLKQYGEAINSKPFWMGEDIKDKTLFVYYESGLGDTIMYARYLSLLKDKCKKVLFKPQCNFVELFKENDFGAEIIDSRLASPDLEFDTHVSLMSLPYVLKLHTEETPLYEGYIKANKEKIKEYKKKYFNNNKFKIGIKWQGNSAYDLSRIITIESFYKLFELPNVQFYSLQKGDGIEEFEKIPKKYNVINLGETFKDFSDTAAATENLDLVICNDTSVAHLAGAMGKTCWILLPFVQNWRWYNDISYTPWYKSAKLFKQIEPENWDEVFDRVHAELKQIL